MDPDGSTALNLWDQEFKSNLELKIDADGKQLLKMSDKDEKTLIQAPTP